MNIAASESRHSIDAATDSSGHIQFSLRSLFAVITIAAIGLAVIPKSNVAIASLFFAPQFGLVAWILWGRLRSSLRYENGHRLSRFAFVSSLVLGMALPTAFGAALLGFKTSDNVALTILLGTLVASPVLIVFHLTRKVRHARIPFTLLHGYNMLSAITISVVVWYILTYVGISC